ncbi:hypothetical protein BH23VER1_BH23VER1_01240 [soil metagenome]
MNARALATTALGVAVAVSATTAAATSDPVVSEGVVFQEIDGFAAVEAEHFFKQSKSDTRAWHITSAKSTPDVEPDGDPSHADTASGGAYVEALPDTRRTHDDPLVRGENFSNEPGVMAILHYKVHLGTPGRYYVWVRAFSTGTEDNGIHVGMDGSWPESGQRLQWTAKNKWAWDSKQRTEEIHTGVPGQIWLDIDRPGTHEIQFSMREDGFEFDKFILTNQKDFEPPADAGPNYQTKEGEGDLPKPAFPVSWGDPPAIQTMDYRPLPGGYGYGSSTVASWIAQNLGEAGKGGGGTNEDGGGDTSDGADPR